MNAVAVDIKDLLVAAGVGVFGAASGWGVYIAVEPVEPDTVVTVYDSGGFAPQYVMNNTVKPLNHPTVQVRVRGTSYLTANAKIQEVVTALDHKTHFNQGGTRYEAIFRMGDPMFLEKDESDRSIWTVNFHVIRKQ